MPRNKTSDKWSQSLQRQLLLNWYPFKKTQTLLEISESPTTLTELFRQRLSEVIQLNPASFKTQKTKNKKFDYVVIVGVLEYSAKHSKGDSPYKQLLTTAKKLLKPGGHLLLATKNKLGLKYLSGSPEDHLGTLFSSLENYPQDQGVRTFTRAELTSLLKKSGFHKIEFYYPFPDYEMPQIVFSEAGLNSINRLTKSSITQTVNYSGEFNQLFNEVAFSHLLAKEEILPKFANSFLVDAN